LQAPKASAANPACRTTVATRADLGQPPCCGVPAVGVGGSAAGGACWVQAEYLTTVLAPSGPCVPPPRASRPSRGRWRNWRR
jgi:hypothetical protein